MTDAIVVSGILRASPSQVYSALLDGAQHSAMTGARAEVAEDGTFSAWSGYIRGRILELEPNVRIFQSWRTSDFSASAPNSRLEILLEPVTNGTRVTFHHSGIPSGQGPIVRQGWVDYYLEPMQAFFSGIQQPTSRTESVPVQQEIV